MSARVDLNGKTFGRLRVKSIAGKDSRGEILWSCECECGGTKIVRSSSLRKGLTRSCGCIVREKTGELHPSWKGGKTIHTNGYVLISRPGHHRANSKGYVYEHILVLEEKLQRRLLPGESCHHIDSNKVNNHPDNLAVITREEHGSLHHSGELNQQAKLTESDVVAIRGLRLKKSRKAIAEQYGVSKAAIDDVLGGRRWKCVGY